LLFLIAIALIAAGEWALIRYVKRHVWIAPAVVLVNVGCCWLLLNRFVLTSILFPYGQSYIKSQVERQLNEKYCQELTSLTNECKQIFA
jgi:hypothetical protein